MCKESKGTEQCDCTMWLPLIFLQNINVDNERVNICMFVFYYSTFVNETSQTGVEITRFDTQASSLKTEDSIPDSLVFGVEISF